MKDQVPSSPAVFVLPVSGLQFDIGWVKSDGGQNIVGGVGSAEKAEGKGAVVVVDNQRKEWERSAQIDNPVGTLRGSVSVQ